MNINLKFEITTETDLWQWFCCTHKKMRNSSEFQEDKFDSFLFSSINIFGSAKLHLKSAYYWMQIRLLSGSSADVVQRVAGRCKLPCTIAWSLHLIWSLDVVKVSSPLQRTEEFQIVFRWHACCMHSNLKLPERDRRWESWVEWIFLELFHLDFTAS